MLTAFHRIEYVMPKGRPPKEFKNFTGLVDRLFATPRAIVKRRLAEARKRAAHNPRTRGPRPKTTDASSA
jgi:hypothetical protein